MSSPSAAATWKGMETAGRKEFSEFWGLWISCGIMISGELHIWRKKYKADCFSVDVELKNPHRDVYTEARTVEVSYFMAVALITDHRSHL